MRPIDLQVRLDWADCQFPIKCKRKALLRILSGIKWPSRFVRDKGLPAGWILVCQVGQQKPLHDGGNDAPAAVAALLDKR